jgi:hypothetical protein
MAQLIAAIAAALIGLAPQNSLSTLRTLDADHVVVIGCVQRAAPLPVGTSGGIGLAEPPARFLLTKGALAVDKDGKPGATQTYRLEADESALTPHVGHKVEITGTIQPSLADGIVTGDPAPPVVSKTSKLKVTDVKMLAQSCSE